ncbi:MAG: 3-deoxy-D-manno-octulosonic acid transferase, partial [Verrucomicrobiales bacterium]|nr:3-deoxy-D-manno-octulosonic acid transferase [Verrucomicrobiales bacterium]
AQLKETGISFAYRSKLAKDTRADCLVVDSTGELRLFYAAATVVFVGKSLTTHGGQNPIEPAALGKAMVYGPNMQNFRAVTTAFADADAALQVRNAAGLEVGLAALLRDAKRRAEMGRNALGVVEQNQGATRRTTDMIARVLQTRSSDRPD